MSRVKERKKYANGAQPQEIANPWQDEVTEQGTFKYAFAPVLFKGDMYPASFELHVQEYDVLEEGEIIGVSRTGQVLYWLHNMIVAKG